MKSYKEIIERLNLKPLPEEGGYFNEVYRSTGIVDDRNYSTAIYYLVTPEEFSHLHKLRSDELFHFYLGDPVQMIQIFPSGELKKFQIGHDLDRNQQPQVVVPAGVWQGTKLLEGGNWALMGCTEAPGFEFSDFEAGSREKLIRDFPQHRALIEAYTRMVKSEVLGRK